MTPRLVRISYNVQTSGAIAAAIEGRDPRMSLHSAPLNAFKDYILVYAFGEDKAEATAAAVKLWREGRKTKTRPTIGGGGL